MSMFFALRKIPEVYPDEMATGGILWFQNLAASDPYLILPLISAGSFLLMIESTKETMMASNAEQGLYIASKFFEPFRLSHVHIFCPRENNDYGFSWHVFNYGSDHNELSHILVLLLGYK